MRTIDFSAKHDVLIRHKDGTLTPMDEPYYEVTKINEDTWQIMSSGDYHYLLMGDEEGISIDTGYGAGNLREFLEELCGKPVRGVINTHHHFDHTANNCYFDYAYMAQDAEKLASIPYASFDGIEVPRDYEKRIVREGDIISLTGRNLQIFEIGDHTTDGIAILDRKRRILFTGDEIMMGMKTLNGSVEKWKRDLDRIAAFRGEFDIICGGPAMMGAEEFDIFHEAASRILEGIESDEEMPELGKPPLGLEPVDGHRVYDCQMPHIEDRPKGGFFKENPNMVSYVYKGRVFTYDKTHIKDAG